MGQLNGQDDDNDHPCVWRSFFVIGARHRPPLAGDFALPEDRGCVRGLGAVPRYPAGFERTGEALRHPLRRPLGHVGGDALGVARATHLLSRDEARRIVNIAKLPELLRPI
jgi:hypothetical protein